MKSLKELEGKSFQGVHGNTITLLKRVRNSTLYYTCNICELKDLELWELGTRELDWGYFKRNKSVSCFCSKTPNYNIKQINLLVSRKANELGFKILEIAHKGGVKDSKVLYEDLSVNKTFECTTNAFLKKKFNQKDCFKDHSRRKKPDEYHIEKFMATGKYVEGTLFKRNSEKTDAEGNRTYWDISCPICSKDNFCKDGICTGWFTVNRSVASNNKTIPCRCNPHYQYNEKETKYILENTLKAEGGKFFSFEGDFQSQTKTKFNWECKVGHRKTTNIHSFLYQGHRCGKCKSDNKNENFFGYYENRSEEEDFLYVLNFNNRYIKVGRSFNVERRIRQLASEAKIPKSKVEVLKLYSGKHKDIYDLEQTTLEVFRQKGFECFDVSWSDELMITDCYDELMEYLDSRTSKLKTLT